MKSYRKIRFALVFNRKGRVNKFGEGLLQVRAYQGGRCRFFSTGIYVKPEDWKERTQRIKISHPNHFVYNQKLASQLERMEAFEIKMINRFGGLSIDRLNEYDNPATDGMPRSFTDFADRELVAANYKPGSHKMYAMTLRKLKAYRSVVYFEELTYKFTLGFDRFLRGQQLGGNTIAKYHSRLGTFIKAAIRQDYLPANQDPYIKFRPTRGEEPKRVYLTSEELARIEALDMEKGSTSHVRDMFLLCCYTGLRFGTANKLTPANIDKTERGLVLITKAEKTGKRIKRPLYLLFQDSDPTGSRPERIIRRHLEPIAPLLNCSGVEKIRLFPYTNQFVNRTLKDIATLAGVSKDVSMHVARRTFATQMATRVKAPVLQRLLQHARPDMTAIYVQLDSMAIDEELEQIKWHERKK